MSGGYTGKILIIDLKDKKALNGISETQYRITQALFLFLIFLELYSVYNNITLSIFYGESMGLNFNEIVSMWNAEPNLNKQYLAYEVQSLHRLNMAILSFGASILLIISSVFVSINRSRNKRVLAALEQCGALKNA